jgi:hypothetical protein
MQLLIGFAKNVTIEQASYNIWQFAGQVLSFSAPQMHPTLNFMLAGPFWAGIIIGCIWIVKSIKPFG